MRWLMFQRVHAAIRRRDRHFAFASRLLDGQHTAAAFRQFRTGLTGEFRVARKRVVDAKCVEYSHGNENTKYEFVI